MQRAEDIATDAAELSYVSVFGDFVQYLEQQEKGVLAHRSIVRILFQGYEGMICTDKEYKYVDVDGQSGYYQV